jgi:hypothetical protein
MPRRSARNRPRELRAAERVIAAKIQAHRRARVGASRAYRKKLTLAIEELSKLNTKLAFAFLGKTCPRASK